MLCHFLPIPKAAERRLIGQFVSKRAQIDVAGCIGSWHWNSCPGVTLCGSVATTRMVPVGHTYIYVNSIISFFRLLIKPFSSQLEFLQNVDVVDWH